VTSALVEEGWLAPARPGPTRRDAALALGTAVAAFLLWMTIAVAWTAPDEGGRPIVVGVDADGAIRIDGDEVVTQLRTRGDTTFVVGQERGFGATRTSTDLQAAPGVDPERIAVRLVPAGGSGDEARVLVAVSTNALPGLGKLPESSGPLRELTQPLDVRADQVQADAARRDQLRERWWLLAILVIALSAGVPLLLWRRARRARFSMRLPGPGTELEAAPPSSLDPVGAAVLVAGARPVDASAAFAGHVLDLVERRQLLMRRTLDPTHGTGVLIGLGQADELDDRAVHVLRSVALDDQITVAVPDSLSRLRRVPVADRAAWFEHVAARERFEGLVDRFDTRRLAIVAGAFAAIGFAALVVGLLTDLPGARATWWLAAAITLPAAASTLLWLRDARTWRVVTRARRLERAQWLAWRAAVGTTAGPVVDQRNVPVIAATGTAFAGVRTFAGPDAVALDAVTAATIVSLRALLHDA